MLKGILTFLISLVMLHASAQGTADTFHLYFDLNVNTLNKNTEKRIDLLIYNDKIINGSTIKVIGYADYLGSEGHNKTLSMQRAQNTRDYLAKNGINAADIKVCIGEGEVERTGMADDKEGYPTDRRVDVVVNNKGKKLPPSNNTHTSASKQYVINNKPKKDTSSFTGKKSTAEMKDLAVMKEGQTIALKNVYFYPGRHAIKPESFNTLEKLYSTLHDNPALRISIEGHVCCIPQGAPDAEDADTGEPVLSFNRAKSIYLYLVDKGISADRLEYKGFGKSHPIVAFEQTEEDAEKNRRVEVRILSK